MSDDPYGRRPLGRSDEDRAFLEGGARALTGGPRAPGRPRQDRPADERPAPAETSRSRRGPDPYADERYRSDPRDDDRYEDDRYAEDRGRPGRRAPSRADRDPYDEHVYRRGAEERYAPQQTGAAPEDRESSGRQQRRPAPSQPGAGGIPGRSAPRRSGPARAPEGGPGRAPRPTRPRADDGEDTERLYESFNDLYEDFDEGRSKTPFVIIGALLAVAIVGGGLAFAYKRSSSDSDGPPVILADRTATKVEPVDPGGLEIPHQNRQIFDQVTGQGADQTEPQLAESDSGEADVAATDENAGQNGAPQDDNAPFTIGALANRAVEESTGGGTSAEAPSPTPPNVQDSGSGVLQPRRVRTVSITADGRVVTDVPDGVAPLGSSRVVQSEPGTTALARMPQDDGGAGLPAPAAPGAQTAPSSLQSGVAQNEALSVARGLSTTDTLTQPPVAQQTGQQAQTTLFAPSPRPKPRPTGQGQQQAALQQQSALQPSTTARPQITQPESAVQTPAALDGFAVQVASHRSQAEAVARYADLQQRFPSLMSGYQPLIQRADLGERGIFFRLRIGPFASRADANRLCSSLKSAGLPGCFVRNL